MTILITGASGFVGRHLLRNLAGTTPIRVLVRAECDQIAAAEVERCVGDLLDPTSLQAACKDVLLVYHLAAVVPGKATRAVLWETNVRGTKNLLEACLKSGVRQLVFMSSVSVYAPPLGYSVSEQHALGGSDTYGQSKSAGETCLLELAKDDLDYVILRPCQVYGPGDQSGYSGQLQRVLESRYVPVAGVAPRPFSLVHVDDLVDAIVAAGTHSVVENGVFNVAGPDQISLRELALEQGARLLITPVAATRKAFELRWLLRNARSSGMQPRCKSYAQDHLHGSLFLGGPKYSIERAMSQLGYMPKVNAREGISRLLRNPNPAVS